MSNVQLNVESTSTMTTDLGTNTTTVGVSVQQNPIITVGIPVIIAGAIIVAATWPESAVLIPVLQGTQ